ncbi:MAG: hypothetical protein VYD19_09260 [Myxococcota bacterium]|nr:hypothetical protein [Myxococcota bacterium]
MSVGTAKDGAREGYLLCVAGEASGDALLADVLTQLHREDPSLSFVGVGGPRSVNAGLQSIIDPVTLAAHGVSEAIGTIPAFLRALKALKMLIPGSRALLLVDFPELNGRLLRAAKRQRRPVAWLAPPQAWAWRSWRWRLVARADWVGCLFPFSASWYATHGVNVQEVGHPLFARPPLSAPERDGVALFPGSRQSVVRRHLPLLLEAAAQLQERDPGRLISLAASPWLSRRWLEAYVQMKLPSLRICESAEEALACSSVAVCVLGTATLEIALSGRDLITVGTLSPLSAFFARRLLTPPLSLPNLLLGEERVPELLLEACTPERIVDAVDGMKAPALEERAQLPLNLAQELRARGEIWRPERVAEGVQELLARAPL